MVGSPLTTLILPVNSIFFAKLLPRICGTAGGEEAESAIDRRLVRGTGQAWRLREQRIGKDQDDARQNDECGNGLHSCLGFWVCCLSFVVSRIHSLVKILNFK